jgi:hypothetical protein
MRSIAIVLVLLVAGLLVAGCTANPSQYGPGGGPSTYPSTYGGGGGGCH